MNAPAQERLAFVCPDCGPTGVDEDGCCLTCGRDAPSQKVPQEPRVCVARGLDGWKLTCVVDEWPDEGIAVLEKGNEELLTAIWRRRDTECGATLLDVEIYPAASAPKGFARTIRDALADAAVAQLGSWGVDAFELS